MGHKSYTTRKREPFSFDIDGGETFTSVGGVQLFELAELGDLADLEADSPEGLAAIGKVFQALLGEAEFQRFRSYCKTHDVDPETLLEILGDAFGELVGHPSARPSDSSDGPPATGHMSRVISASAGTVIEMPLSPQREAELRAAVAAAAEIPESA